MKVTTNTTGDTGRRSSIEETLLKPGDKSVKASVDKALQSLIVSPTYFDLTKSDVPEVSKFLVIAICWDLIL